MRLFVLTVMNEKYHSALIDLPCIIETQKTFNNNIYYKSGDISQMLVVYPKDWDGVDSDLIEMVDGEGQINFRCKNGLTPPTLGIRKYFREDLICCCPSKTSNMDLSSKCPSCKAIPKSMISKVVDEINMRCEGKPNDLYLIEEEEYEVEVTDDEWEEFCEEQHSDTDLQFSNTADSSTTQLKYSSDYVNGSNDGIHNTIKSKTLQSSNLPAIYDKSSNIAENSIETQFGTDNHEILNEKSTDNQKCVRPSSFTHPFSHRVSPHVFNINSDKKISFKLF